ncbi:MAG TPA: MFS transporter [Chloroflexota bacterium]|nr:MFS transporter [Chloroflexota bacterium]
MPHLRSLALDIEPLRVHRDFRLIFCGQLINTMGSQITQVALPYELYLLTRSALALGAMATIQLIAVLLVSPMAGAVADAVDRRRLLLGTQVGLCSVSTALALLAASGQATPWQIYLLAFVQAGVNALDRPARQAIVPRLVSRKRLTAAITLNQVGTKTASVLGPSVGGLLIASTGLSLAFGLDAASFLAGIAALLAIAGLPPLGEVAKPGWSAILEGLSYVKRTPAVLAAFCVDLDAMIFGLPVALFPILALNVFHAGATGLGLLTSAPAAGAVIGGLSSGWLRRVRHPGRVVLGAVGVWGVAITLFGFTRLLPLALVFLALAGGADAISAVMRWTIIQVSAPDQLRGRVTALNSMVVNAGPRLGDMEATGIAALISVQVSVISGGLLSLLGLIVVARAFPRFATFDAQMLEAAAARGMAPTEPSLAAGQP